jgi:hypothetical protein
MNLISRAEEEQWLGDRAAIGDRNWVQNNSKLVV